MGVQKEGNGIRKWMRKIQGTVSSKWIFIETWDWLRWSLFTCSQTYFYQGGVDFGSTSGYRIGTTRCEDDIPSWELKGRNFHGKLEWFK